MNRLQSGRPPHKAASESTCLDLRPEPLLSVAGAQRSEHWLSFSTQSEIEAESWKHIGLTKDGFIRRKLTWQTCSYIYTQRFSSSMYKLVSAQLCS